MAVKPLISNSIFGDCWQWHARQAALGLGTFYFYRRKAQFKPSASKMASPKAESNQNSVRAKTIDSHLHIWASPQEVNSSALTCFSLFPLLIVLQKGYNILILHSFLFIQAADKYPYSPGQNPTLPGHLDFLLQVSKMLKTIFFFWAKTHWYNSLNSFFFFVPALVVYGRSKCRRCTHCPAHQSQVWSFTGDEVSWHITINRIYLFLIISFNILFTLPFYENSHFMKL